MTGRNDVGRFFLLAVGITWLFWVPGALQTQGLLDVAIPAPVLFLGGAGPLIAAVLLTAREAGGEGVRRLLRPLLRWRVSWRWYAAAVLAPVGVHYAPALVADALGWIDLRPGLPVPPPLFAVAVLGFLVMYSLEEVGWRGYALPRLQARHSPWTAGLLVGLVWTAWHLPLVWSPDAYAGEGPLVLKVSALLVFMVTISLLFTWIYNGSGGSLLLANLTHVSVNLSFATLGIDHPRAWIFELVLPALATAVFLGGLTLLRGPGALAPGGAVTPAPEPTPAELPAGAPA